MCFTFSLSNGVLIFQKLEKTTDQRKMKTSWDSAFEHCSNCLVPERPNICTQWNLCGELGISGAHGAVKSHLFMVITEKVYLHVCPKQELWVVPGEIMAWEGVEIMDWVGVVHCSSEESAGIVALLAQGTSRRSSGGWNPVKWKTNGKLGGRSGEGGFPLGGISLEKEFWD